MKRIVALAMLYSGLWLVADAFAADATARGWLFFGLINTWAGIASIGQMDADARAARGVK